MMPPLPARGAKIVSEEGSHRHQKDARSRMTKTRNVCCARRSTQMQYFWDWCSGSLCRTKPCALVLTVMTGALAWSWPDSLEAVSRLDRPKSDYRRQQPFPPAP